MEPIHSQASRDHLFRPIQVANSARFFDCLQLPRRWHTFVRARMYHNAHNENYLWLRRRRASYAVVRESDPAVTIVIRRMDAWGGYEYLDRTGADVRDAGPGNIRRLRRPGGTRSG